MTTWRVLKWEDHEEADNSITNLYREVGTHESDASYWLGTDAAQRIGEKFGAGEYLLFSEDNRANSLRIGERSEFYEIEDVEPGAPEPSLQAVPSAAEIMERDG